ncbi:MAG: tetratricopeptide repeat protein [Endomicrobiales bacterium]|nr:tetratricopeptide repeat protein [Endomicrobiales bacterium]
MADTYRKQIKKDELTELLINSVYWVKENRTLFLSIAGTVLGIAALSLFFFTRYYELKVRASDKLSIAQGQLYQGQTDQALAILNEIITRYSNSAVASQARILKANYLISIQNYNEAENIIKPAIEKGKPNTVIPLAMNILGLAQENSQKYPDAIETYKAFIDKFPNHFLAPKALESLARNYEMNQSIPEAISTYEKMANLYPNTGWAQKANERIGFLSRK